MTTVMPRPQPKAMAPSVSPMAAFFYPNQHSANWVCAHWWLRRVSTPKRLNLAGTVVMDPNAGGKVQAALAGRLKAGPKGLPGVGQTVRKGEVLAYVVPTAGAIERSNQVAQQAELRAARALAEPCVARLKDLQDTVPRKDIEALQVAVANGRA